MALHYLHVNVYQLLQFYVPLAQPSISYIHVNDRTMAAVKQKLTNVNAEIPVVEGKHEEYVCFLAYATIANWGMEASEGSSWASVGMDSCKSSKAAPRHCQSSSNWISWNS